MEDLPLLDDLVREAAAGSRSALEKIVGRIQGRIYGLALRMLYHPADAEDATQEILIKVITRLDGFRGDGPFRAWVYRIAVNHLKSARKNRWEQRESLTDKAQRMIDRAQAMGWFDRPRAAPDPILELEMRSACTQALLATMDRDLRVAFILGVVMDVSGQEGGHILGVSPAAYRKRLSRARTRMKDFLSRNCDLFDPANRCSCGPTASGHVREGWLNPDKPVFVDPNQAHDRPEALRDYMRELDQLGKVSALFRSLDRSGPAKDYSTMVKSLLEKSEYRILSRLRPD